MLHALRVIIWAPFGLVTNKPLMLAAFLAGSFYTAGHPFNPFLLAAMGIVMGIAIPIEAQLRPHWRQRSGSMPARQAPILPTLALIAVGIKGKAPRAGRIPRHLAPELRKLLALPRDRQPEAILYQQRQAQA